MADSQHPDWNYRCNLWRAGLGPDPGPPPDPQHPAVPFEQAVDLLTGEPRQLRPQHPDIAAPTLEQMPALIAKHDEFAALAAEHGHDEMAALHAVTAAALRTLARPVEPIEPVEPTEPTAEDEEMVAGLIGFLRDDLAPACQREGCRLARPVEDEEVRRISEEIDLLQQFLPGPAVSDLLLRINALLARLASEKASAEQERAGWEAIATTQKAERKRAEQERDHAEQREELWVNNLEKQEVVIRDLRETLTLYRGCRHGQVECFCTREAERALAAAAGAEEPRSAVPGAPSPRWRQISPETEAGLKALDEATRLGPHRARKMPPTGEEEPR